MADGTVWNTDNLIRGLLGGLCLAGVLGGVSLGRSDAGQDQRIEANAKHSTAIEARQDRESAAFSAALVGLREEVQRERERRERDMSEMRAYLVEILKEVKRR